jgi:predicted lipid-binding transport protein (Tim44 family)
MRKLWTVVAGMAFVLGSVTAEAARIGGGKSMGRQSTNVTQREAAKPTPAPTQAQTAAPSANPAAAQAGAAGAAKRPWGAMLGGLAAGLGLAWLASALGFGEAFAQFLMAALLAVAVMMLVAWFMRSRQKQASAGQDGRLAYQGASAAGGDAAAPRSYRPENVGNDASARPWERSSAMGALESGGSGTQRSMIGAALGGSQAWGVPAGFDVDGFLSAARSNFVSLQAAWDRADVSALRAMMTDDMVSEVQGQLAERAKQVGVGANRTEVVTLEAKLLGIEDLGDVYMASVEFTGAIREDDSAGPNPFREVWNMTKPTSGRSGWLVAGVQALQ